MKFLIAHTHPILRVGLKTFLMANFPDIAIDECVRGEQTWIERIARESYDLVIIDIDFDGSRTIELIRQAKNNPRKTKFLVFTNCSERSFIKKIFDGGIDGYIKQTEDLSEIKKAIMDVLNNKKYVSNHIKNFLCENFLNETGDSPLERLSPRETEIARRLVNGQKVSEISIMLNLGNSTISTLKSRVFRKLNIRNVLELRELFLAGNFVAIN